MEAGDSLTETCTLPPRCVHVVVAAAVVVLRALITSRRSLCLSLQRRVCMFSGRLRGSLTQHSPTNPPPFLKPVNQANWLAGGTGWRQTSQQTEPLLRRFAHFTVFCLWTLWCFRLIKTLAFGSRLKAASEWFNDAWKDETRGRPTEKRIESTRRAACWGKRAGTWRFWCSEGLKKKNLKKGCGDATPSNKRCQIYGSCKLNWKFNGIITERQEVGPVCPECS